MTAQTRVSRWLGGALLLACLVLAVARAEQYRSEEMVAPAAPSSAQRSPQQMLKTARDPYQRAMLLRDLAAQAVGHKDYSAATGYLQKALAENALSAPAQALMRQQLTALLSASGDPHAVVKALEPLYRRNAKLAPGQLVALGAAYLKLKRDGEALGLLERGVAALPEPPVAWLEALAAAQMATGHAAQAEPTLARIVQAAPNVGDHWLRLAEVELQLGDTDAASTTLELAARLGYLTTPAQRFELVAVMAKAGLPFEAASLLQRELQAGRIESTAGHWKTLGALWAQARERTLARVALRKAIDLGGASSLYAQIGQLALQSQDYAGAASALAKGAQTPEMRMNLGLAQFRAGDVAGARTAFQHAEKAGGKHAEQARQWLAFLQTAGARAEATLAAKQAAPPLAPARVADAFVAPPVRLSATEQAAYAPIAAAPVEPAELAPLASGSGRLTPVGAERAGSADGTVPAWVGGLTPAHWPKGWHPGERLVDPFPADKPLFTVTAANVSRYAQYLAPGYLELFRKYPDYKMIVYPSRRTVSYPEAIYKATQANLGRARLLGPDALVGARLGFPFPRPDNGVQVMWNHRLRYRGGSLKQQSTQAVVFPDGQRQFLHQTELVYSRYANIEDPVDIDRDNILLDYLTWFERAGGGFDFAALVHETANSLKKPRAVWVIPPHLKKIFRIPPVGYDQPFPGSNGIYFIDMVDMYNGPFDRYVWKLVGKREMLVPYNDYRLAAGRYSYDELLTPRHFNQNAVRYEMHRVWQIDATLREGATHAFGKRVFYVDEDSWNVVLVDNYDHDNRLWRFQEGHLLALYGVQAANCEPVVTYDFRTGAYFVNHLIGHEPVPEYHLKGLSERQFLPSAVRARFAN